MTVQGHHRRHLTIITTANVGQITSILVMTLIGISVKEQRNTLLLKDKVDMIKMTRLMGRVIIIIAIRNSMTGLHRLKMKLAEGHVNMTNGLLNIVDVTVTVKIDDTHHHRQKTEINESETVVNSPTQTQTVNSVQEDSTANVKGDIS